MLEVLAAKTGYEPDMIEMDMALETELGVDSIKRVEILSDVQKELGVEAQDVAALSRTQTVGEVVEAMLKELGGAGAAPAPPAAPVAAPAAPSSGFGRVAGEGDRGRARRARRQDRLRAGHDRDDMALETELGVDSIKRVEILSDVQKELGVEAQDVAALSRTQTVGEVVEAMLKEIAARWPAPPRRRRRRASAPAAAASADSSGRSVSPAKATDGRARRAAAKTGYEPDMIEMDMALETELGVDSIKRVEILSDVQKELGVEAQDVAALSRTQTVGEVVEAMIKEIGGAGAAPVAAAALRPRGACRRRAVVGRVAGEGDRGRARRARRQDGLRAGHDRDGHGARDGARRRLDQARRDPLGRAEGAQRRGAGRRRALAHADRRRGRRGDAQGDRQRWPPAAVPSGGADADAPPSPRRPRRARRPPPPAVTAAKDALAQTGQVSLTYASVEAIAPASKLAIFSPSRPIIVVDEGTPFTAGSSPASSGAITGCKVVVLSFAAGAAARACRRDARRWPTAPSRRSRTIAIAKAHGKPSGFIYQHSRATPPRGRRPHAASGGRCSRRST